MTRKTNDSSDLLNYKHDADKSLHSCNKYFVSVGKRLADAILTKLCVTQDQLIETYKSHTTSSSSFFFHPTDTYEVTKIILQLKSDSAPGPDRVTVPFIKKSLRFLIVPLTHVMNLSLSSGTFPDIWKIAAVSPIFKSGSKKQPENYRPIALLNIISKILEKIVSTRFVSFLEKNQILSPRQFGFRSGRSTEDAVTQLTNSVAKFIENGEYCIAVFIDLAKAFDTVSVGLLLKKLETIGIRGLALDWFRSYLTNRMQFIKIGSCVSSPLPIDYGVPQGSILGPTLFTLYVNDIVSLQLRKAEIITYADDTVIIFHESSWNKVYRCAEQGLSQIQDILDGNLLTLNVTKTKYIAFSKTRASCPPNNLALKIHSCQNKNSNQVSNCTCSHIDRVEKIRYLGIIIDENLSYKEQVIDISSRVRKLIFIMKTLRNCTPFDILRDIYLALCQSILQYCITIWGTACKTTFITVERAQRALLKVTLNKPFRFSTNILYNQFKVLSVRKLFILNATIKTHTTFLKHPDYKEILARRAFRLPLPQATSLLTRRSPAYAHINTYNNVCKVCDIKDCRTSICKLKIKEWLQQLSYEETENIFA